MMAGMIGGKYDARKKRNKDVKKWRKEAGA